MISSIVAFITGSVMINYYYGLFILVIFLLLMKGKKELSLIIYLLFLIFSFYYIKLSLDTFIIALPSLLLLDYLLEENFKVDKEEIIFSLLFLISFFNNYLFLSLVFLKLMKNLYKKYNIRFIFLYITYIIILVSLLLFLDVNIFNKILILIGFGCLSFIAFLYEVE
ncbi:hypothetical protein Metin_1254 [Methanocaldococcus infernus ME]|uniref:Uncharacterized protein n=1 Tax=Methanocaldococcus infernus (strain DSM 11812 / JCM 15783 / ME) TaxID=573063 RepID=D5VTK3_METIM|nr:hypothetical protein Metin_1254 [Methanocaldococcus infernus ME]